jgi:type I restriction enzyme, S subunit
MFEPRPRARKWLSVEQLQHPERLYVPQGTILVRRSADVGRSMLTCAHHERHLISDHFFRIEPRQKTGRGWLYAFVRSKQGRAMMTGTQYGHIIQHIEKSHLRALPVPTVPADIAADFEQRLLRILKLRNDAHRSAQEADSRFADAIGPIKPKQKEAGFTVRASDVLEGRRRFDAAYYAPGSVALLRQLKRVDLLCDVTSQIWLPDRLKRFYGDGGIPYLTADEVFSVNPQDTKSILLDPANDYSAFFVQPGWIVMARSGQVYGLIGAAALMTEHHAKMFISDDLIRIVADNSKIRSGYLLVALTHRTHGRPLLIRAAYGTSIPHLDPGDVSEFPVVRLDGKTEDEIADLAEASARSRADADAIERGLGTDASAIIDRFIAGKSLEK